MSINGNNDLTVEDIPKLLNEIDRLETVLNGDGLLTLPEQLEHAREEIKRLDNINNEMRVTFRLIDAVIDSHRLVETMSADELADEIIKLISELERKVGEIT